MKLENKKGEYLMALVDLTSVTTGNIGTNTNFIVEENKVLKRISQSSLLKTSAISTTQVNSTTNVPSSSLVYSMNQSINKLNSDLDGFTFYKSLEQLSISSGFIPDIVAAMPFSSIFVIQCIEGQVISNESRNQLPSANGLLEIIKSTTGRTRVLYTTGTNTSKTGLYLCDLDEISNTINRWLSFAIGNGNDLEKLKNHILISSDGSVALYSNIFGSLVCYKLQLEPSGTITLYKSNNGGVTFGESNTILNGFNTHLMKTYQQATFDFNNTDYEAGCYRLGSSESIVNSPIQNMNYGNVLVIRENSYNTLAMLAFPFNQNGRILYRQGNVDEWATAQWFYFEGMAINNA